MDHRILKGADVKVSRICLGTMTFGSQVAESEAVKIVHAALDAGVNFVDTADVYNGGESERITGAALKGKRDGVVLATKVGLAMRGRDEPGRKGLGEKHIMASIDESLARLGTDYIDLYYMHAPDYDTPIEESLAAFDKCIKQGKVKHVGMSNYASWQLCEALWQCDRNTYPAPVITQVPYNLITRGIEEDLRVFCAKYEIGFAVYNPLAGGLLTGKHSRTAGPLQHTRLADNKLYKDRYWKDENLAALAELARIAGEAGKTPVELAFQWLAAREFVDSVIIGVSRFEQLEADLQAWDGPLDESTLQACDAVWARLRGDYFRHTR